MCINVSNVSANFLRKNTPPNREKIYLHGLERDINVQVAVILVHQVLMITTISHLMTKGFMIKKRMRKSDNGSQPTPKTECAKSNNFIVYSHRTGYSDY